MPATTLSFNTGFTMTFSFSSSWDTFYAEEDGAKLVWTNAVLDDITERLEALSGSIVCPLDVSEYADNMDGTLNLWLDMLEEGHALDFAIGIVIFHQLLYKTPLTATKLTG